MSFNYTWIDAEQKMLRREDGNGHVLFIPVSLDNKDYLDFLESGTTVPTFVAPSEPDPLTPEQKLANTGLTVDELKTLLSL